MKEVPFFPNLEDDLHCFQSTIKSILKFFLPNEEYSISELEIFTGFEKNKWTWPTQAILNLLKKNFEITIFDDYDYQRFANEGAKYQLERYGEEVGSLQIKNSNIDKEQNLIKELLKQPNIEFIQKYSLNDLKKKLMEGYLIDATLNIMRLNDKEGYSGHSVLIYGIDNEFVYLHDPGLPPVKNRKETIKKFEFAWEETHDAYAFRLRK